MVDEEAERMAKRLRSMVRMRAHLHHKAPTTFGLGNQNPRP